MKNHKYLILLLAIVFIAGFLRLFKLGGLPIIANRDEAALGYNAILLAETGKDEWQQTWPLALKSFGDYKLPVYTWFLIPLFKIFPANDFLLRLPAAVAGIWLCFISFYFAKEFQLKKKWAIIFSGLTAVTPVFFFYSRMAWEANLALAIFVTAIYLLFKKSLLSNFLALFLIIIACFTYNTPYLLLPFLIILLFYFQFKQAVLPVKQTYKFLFCSGNKKIKWSILMGLCLIFIVISVKLLPLSSQKSGITVFTDETVWANYINYRNNLPSYLTKILGSRYLYWFGLMIKNFLNSFSYQFLVKKGGSHPWHNISQHSHLYSSVYVIGIASLLINLARFILSLKFSKIKINYKISFLILLTIISLAPVIITTDAPHATRSLLFFYLVNFFAVFGMQEFLKNFYQRKKIINLLLLCLLLITTVETTKYFYHYFISYPSNQLVLKPGFQQIVNQVKLNNVEKKPVAVVDPSGYQYILLAWYLKLEPPSFFSTIVHQLPDSIGLNYGEQVANYHFIVQEQDRSEDEKFLVFWDNNDDSWQIKNF